ncbi:MAG: Multidrug resistance protein Stp [Herbaspirillum frisingense]|uniref:Multidrug resistance protein Stp n=1 Tax=Herbaspirillum frisingense TaxID=92645 RepID=A0A7V8FXF0_9BURK|nr:MAG: Multidrug resistance protein Stp [Herbaspirillum frisingense]
MRTLFSTPTGRVLLTGSLGCAMTVLDTNVVGIVLPTIARDLGASFADIEWVVSAYVLCFAALLLPAGSIADRYGRKRVFLCGITLFALTSLACAWASSAQALYAARAAQGVGAAFLLAPALAVIGHAFHDEAERARAWAVWGGIMGLTMVLAPLIGGAINALLGWRWAFAINLPICLLLGAAVLRNIPESRNPAPRPLDVPGILSFSSAVFMLTWALITGPERGWSSVVCVARGMGGALLFALFIAVERRRAHPMLDLSLFHSPGFVAAVAAMFAYAASAQVMASLLPLFLQNARGLDAASAGLAMLPFALAMLLLPQLGRKLGQRLPCAQILALGLCTTALGNLLMMLAARSASAPLTVLGMAVLGSGGGLLNGETQKAFMGNVPRDRACMASGISTTSRFTGVLAGFAGLGAVLAEGARDAMARALATVEGGSAHATEFIARAMAGDFDDAAHLYPQQQQAVIAAARRAYGAGFSHVFTAAALLALCAAGVVIWSIRRSSRPAPATPRAAEPIRRTPRS